MACDPIYTLEYTIENNTGQNINILYSPQQNRDSIILVSSSISDQTKVSIFNEESFGYASSVLKNISEIPIDSLVITNAENKTYSKDVFELSNWSKFLLTDQDDAGFMNLEVKEEDFE